MLTAVKNTVGRVLKGRGGAPLSKGGSAGGSGAVSGGGGGASKVVAIRERHLPKQAEAGLPGGWMAALNHLKDQYGGGVLRGDYNAAKQNRFREPLTGVIPSGSGADHHYRLESHYYRMIELSRKFDRDNSVVAQGVDRVIDNVVQDGIKLDPQTGDKALDRQLSQRWADWCGDPSACDRGGRFGFHEIERLAMRHTIIDGDHVVLPLRSGQLELIEGHRLRGPHGLERTVHGVQMELNRRPVRYHITKYEPGPFATQPSAAKTVAYPARDPKGRSQVFHVYDPRRVSQTRGVTALAPVVDTVAMHDDVQFAKMVQQKLVSCFAVFHKFAEQVEDPGAPPATGRESTLDEQVGLTMEGKRPGIELFGQPGEELVGFSPNVPNSEFFQHATMLLTFVAINLNLPVAVLLLDPSNTNFSGWRGAMDQARMGFRAQQKKLIQRLHRRVYHWKLSQWLQTDRELLAMHARAGVDVFNHRWNAPGWSYIEPLKDVKARKEELESNLTSPRRSSAKNGEDWEEVAGEIAEDRGKLVVAAIEKAKQINQLHPEANVTWRELAGFKPIKAATPVSRTAGAPTTGTQGGRDDN